MSYLMSSSPLSDSNLRACLARMGSFCWANVSAVKMTSVLKRKKKGHLYGETERNRCIQTGPNSNHSHHPQNQTFNFLLLLSYDNVTISILPSFSLTYYHSSSLSSLSSSPTRSYRFSIHFSSIRLSSALYLFIPTFPIPIIQVWLFIFFSFALFPASPLLVKFLQFVHGVSCLSSLV